MLKNDKAVYDQKYAKNIENRFGIGPLAKQSDVIIEAAEPYIQKNATILEVGCSTGKLLTRINGRFGKKAKKIYGKDVNSEALQIAKARHLNVSYGDAQDLSDIPDNSVDVIFSLHTYEHVPNIAKGFGEIHRILKKNGRAFLILPPNFYGLETFWLAKQSLPPKESRGILGFVNAFKYARRLHCSNLGGPLGGAKKHAVKILKENNIRLKVTGKMHPELWFANFLIFEK